MTLSAVVDSETDFDTGDSFRMNVTTGSNNDYIFIADTGNDRIKVVKGADNGGSENGTDTDYFADDAEHQDYYGEVTAETPNLTFVSAVTAMEDTYTIYTTDDVDEPTQTAWTMVDNFGGSSADDKHFTYDYQTKVVMFGDGARGEIPEEGQHIFAYYKPTLDVLQYGVTGSCDGNFNAPAGVDARWNATQGWYDVYVSDTGNDRVVKLKFMPAAYGSLAKMEWVTSWTASFTGASLSEPTDLQVISTGQDDATDEVYLFVCDTGNDRVIVYRDSTAENEGDGGAAAPVFTTVIGSNGVGLGEFSRPCGVSVMQEGNVLKVYVVDSERGYTTKFMRGDDPDIEVDWDISSYGYLPTGSYTFNKLEDWSAMAKDYEEGAYIMFFYSDTSEAGQANPRLCSNERLPASTTTSYVWRFSQTPGGAPLDGTYYLYARLYDVYGILRDEDNSIDETDAFITIDVNLGNGIGAFDSKDGDDNIYLQNGSIRQFNLTAIYPDSVAAISYNGSFPASKMKILNIVEGPGWQSVQHENTIFESNFNNVAGTFSVSTAVLGSSSGLVSGPPVYTMAIVTVQVDDEAITTKSRVYKDMVNLTLGSWSDYQGNTLANPTLNDLNLKIGYLGDIADSTGAGRGTIPNMTPNPDGKFGINDLVVFTMAWNGRGGRQDMIADLAPYEGESIPDIWSNPDGKLDVQDLMAFTAMFDWYNANVNSFSLPQPSEPAPQPSDGGIASTGGSANVRIDARKEDGRTVLEVFADEVKDLQTAEIDVVFDRRAYSLQDCQPGDFLAGDFFRAYACGSGLRIFLSDLTNAEGVSGSGKLVEVVLESLGDGSDLTVGYDLRDADGAVIDAGCVRALTADVPREFSFSAAYPNPFNSLTRLTYGLPEASSVNLSVFDVNGRLVAELVNGEVSAGYHSAVWDASSSSAGLYLVRLENKGHTGVQKVMLVK